MKTNSRGLTLIELMIVIAIIGLVAAIAIPNAMRARLNANEGAIKSSLKTFSTANETFRSSQNPPTYAANLAALTAPPVLPPFLDASWNNPARGGFNLAYAVAAAPANSYSMRASPTVPGQTANNTYCIDQTGILVGSTADGTANVPAGAATGCVGGVASQ